MEGKLQLLNTEFKNKQNVIINLNQKQKPGAPAPKPANSINPPSKTSNELNDELTQQIDRLNDKIIV